MGGFHGGVTDTQPVTGTITSVGTFWPATQTVTGTVEALGTFWPATQTVTGTVGINIGSGIQQITGTVGLSQAANVNVVAPNSSLLVTVVQVLSSSTAIPSSQLANRRSMEIQNLGSGSIYVSATGSVVTGSGREIDPYGGTWALDIGSNISLWAIASSSQVAPFNTRITEIA